MSVMSSVEQVKSHMERNTKDGIRCRSVWLDWTQSASLQTKGAFSKHMAIQPSKSNQDEVVAGLTKLPYTPITGALVIRTGPNMILHDFFGAISKMFTSNRSLFVPIDVPAHYERIQASAARRALGPLIDHKERSGVELKLRMLGAGDPSLPLAEDDEEQDEEEEDEAPPDPQEQQSKDGEMSVDCMTDGQMKQRFGRHALHVFGAMFQHVCKITEQARFLEVNDSAMMSTMSGAKRIYRKGQLHETVVLSALKSQLATTASGIGALDGFVQYFGGTPEGIVGAILAGYPHVFYLGSDREISWMTLPTLEEEHACKIVYQDYTSPNPEVPEQGILAVRAVKTLATYIRNHVLEHAGTITLAPPRQIEIPPLRTYTFIPVTGRVIARTIMPTKGDAASSAASAAKSGAAASSSKPKGAGQGSIAGTEQLSTPKTTYFPIVIEADAKEENEADEVGDDEQGSASAEEDDISRLEKLEKAEQNKKQTAPQAKKGQKRKAPA